jgi:protein-S-isoprenylcysteine O-methyltransferase Ste14
MAQQQQLQQMQQQHLQQQQQQQQQPVRKKTTTNIFALGSFVILFASRCHDNRTMLTQWHKQRFVATTSSFCLRVTLWQTLRNLSASSPAFNSIYAQVKRNHARTNTC